MSTKHTPGPWSFSPQKGTPGHCHMAQVWNSEKKPLADIEPTQNEGEASANARLIAAAPELLEALIALAYAYQSHVFDGHEDEEYSKAIEVIVKAESNEH